MIAPLIAEFVGTFALIFVGVGAIASDHLSGGASGLVGIALAHGLVIAVMASATGAISGGHLNPAVTIAMFVTRRMQFPRAAGYVIAQCAAAVLAAFLLTILIPVEALVAVKLGTPIPAVTTGTAVVIEAILTFFLVFVIFGTAVDPRAPKCGGLFIGLAVALDILIGGPLTGAAMNPARHLGPAIFHGTLGDSWIYWLGPIAGGIVAGLVYEKMLLQKRPS